jgi:hypothetical protein
MDNKEKTMVVAYVLVTLIIIGILIALLKKKKDRSEAFNQCICQGIGPSSMCQNTKMVEKSYNEGITENNPRWRKPAWTTVSPGDPNFPVFSGCGAPRKNNGWEKWDFTDFGSDPPKEMYTYDENQPYRGTISL